MYGYAPPKRFFKGWPAVILSIRNDSFFEGEATAVLGELHFYPDRKNRSLPCYGGDLSLNAFFHCYKGIKDNSLVEKLLELGAGTHIYASGELCERFHSRGIEEAYDHLESIVYLEALELDATKGSRSAFSSLLSCSHPELLQLASLNKEANFCVRCGQPAKLMDGPYNPTKFCPTCEV